MTIQSPGKTIYWETKERRFNGSHFKENSIRNKNMTDVIDLKCTKTEV